MDVGGWRCQCRLDYRVWSWFIPTARAAGSKGVVVMKRMFGVVVASLLLLAFSVAGSPAASAYGNSGAHQTYQLTFSQNCDNPSLCGGGGGGFWGWAVLYSDGTGDAELTGCGHLTHAGGPGTAGAQHFSDNFTYDLTNTTEFVTISETQTFVGSTRFTQTVPGGDTGIPLTPGHYNTSQLLGFSAPGVSLQVQVVKLH